MEKNILLSLIFVLCFFSVTAQNFEWNIQPQLYSEVEFGIPTPTGDWILGGRANTPYLVKLDSLGALKWGTTDFPFGEFGSIEEMIFDSDTSYIAIGGYLNINGLKEGFIRRYHINGASLSKIEELFTTSSSFAYPYEYQKIDLFDEETMLVSAFSSVDRKAMIISFDGNTLWETETSSFISDVLVLDDDKFIVVESEPRIVKYNADYSIDTIVLVDEYIHQIEHFTNNEFLSAANSKIQTRNQDFQIQKTFSHPEIDSISHFYIYDNEIFLTGKNKNEIPFIIKLNEDLEEQFYITFGNEFIYPNQIIVTEDQIGIGGKANLFTPINPNLVSPPSTFFFKTFSKTGFSLDLTTDVAIEDFEVGSIIKPNLQQNIFEVKNVEMMIKNLGSDTLNTIRVIKPNQSIEKLFNLQIPPNESQRVNLSDFDFSSSISFDRYKFCLSISVPNQKMDRNPTNNGMCKNITVGEIREEEVVESIIFPNPVLNVIKLNPTVLSSDYDLTIVNSIGQEMIHDEYLYTIPKTIDVSNLSDGVYFLILKNEEDRKVVSFVKR